MKFLRQVITKMLVTLSSAALTLIIFMGLVYILMSLDLPDVRVLREMHLQTPLKVYSRHGKLMAIYGSKRRIPVRINEIPTPLVNAVLATEDARFYEHPGVDFVGLIRAARAVLTSGRKVQGASTITMQVARNFFLTKKKTYSRKIKEILLALRIDKYFAKPKILELYLNKVYFGKRAYGVAAAASVYYGKSLKDLTLSEMAMIAGLPQAPSRNNPLTRPQAALKRRNHVLGRMLSLGYITKDQYDKASLSPLTASFHGEPISLSAPYVAEMVRQQMFDRYGDKAYEMGLSVYTTIEAKYQSAANHALQNGLEAYSMRHGYHGASLRLPLPMSEHQEAWLSALESIAPVNDLEPAAVTELGDQRAVVMLTDGRRIQIPWAGLSWARPALGDGELGPLPQSVSNILQVGDVIWVRHGSTHWALAQIPKVQGALVSLNPQTGEILALSGGFDYSVSNFNRATQAQRQSGSAFKPFIYSAALEKGYTLATTINDAPVVKEDTGENALWRPQNDSERFYGPTRLRIGLTKSRNLVSVRLLDSIGIPFTLAYLQRFYFNPKSLPHSLSLALGSGLVTPLDIARGYAVFANGGHGLELTLIDKIMQNQGLVYPNQKKALSNDRDLSADDSHAITDNQVITPQNAYLITRALQGVIQHGTGRAARILHRHDLAGKTGTTNNQVDAWFSGYSPNVLSTVWVGFDNMQSLHEYGAQAALPIWIDFMRHVLIGIPEQSFSQSPDIVTARIDPKTGLLARPGDKQAIFEEFRKGRQPTTYSPQDDSSLESGASESDEPLF